jgi:asparagine synthase (glutamine-hydrolysing)
MPGIVGIITKRPAGQAVPELLRMLSPLSHEAFYVTGTWYEESLQTYVGWSAREEAFPGAMPVEDERSGVALVFSGEEYSELALVQDGAGDHAEPSCLSRFSAEGSSFPASLNGRFHGVLTDRRRNTTVLFNDRYGMHRLYYYQSREAFYFAAEAKSILAIRPETRSIDPRSLGEFVACGSVLENRTLFADIQVLPPASAWVFRDGSLESKGTYFDPKEWEEQEPLDPESYYSEFRRVFAQNLPQYFRGHDRIAMSLTGGLDTRMVMAWQKSEAGSLPCYTYGGTLRECKDVSVARRVARACEQPYQVIGVGKDFLSQFPRYAERTVYLTDGCADVSRAPDLYLSECARQVAPVRMTGLYGSEVLRGVRAFKAEEPVPGLFAPELVRSIHQAGRTFAENLQCHPLSFAVFKQAPWCHYGALSVEQTQLAVRTPFLDNELVRTTFRAPSTAPGKRDFSLRLIADGNPDLLRIPTDRGIGGSGGRFSTALSHGLLEFLFKAEYAYDMGMPQWLARADRFFMPLHLERLFLGRHKIFHFRVWYRDLLAQYVREILLDRRSVCRPYIEPKGLEAVVQAHIQGSGNYTNQIHQLLTLELLHRIFLEGSGAHEFAAQPSSCGGSAARAGN